MKIGIGQFLLGPQRKTSLRKPRPPPRVLVQFPVRVNLIHKVAKTIETAAKIGATIMKARNH
jgi:hypothetical protein